MLFRSDRKSTRLNSSHTIISYAVFCLKKKNTHNKTTTPTHTQQHQPNTKRTHTSTANVTPDTPYIYTYSNIVIHILIHFFFFLMRRRPPKSTLFPFTAPFR